MIAVVCREREIREREEIMMRREVGRGNDEKKKKWRNRKGVRR